MPIEDLLTEKIRNPKLHLEMLHRDDPADLDIMNSLGRRYEIDGEFEKAKKMYKKEMESDPARIRPYVSLGILHQDKSPEDALYFLYSALEIEKDPDAMYHIALIKEKQGKGDEALDMLKRIDLDSGLGEKVREYIHRIENKLQPTDTESNGKKSKMRLLPFSLLIAGMLSFQLVVGDTRDLGLSDWKRAESHMRDHDYRSALSLYRQVHSETGDFSVINYRIGECYSKLGRWKQAIPFLQRAVENGEAKAYSLYHLGYCQHHIGENESAIENFRKSIQINDGFAYSHFDLGKTYLANGDNCDALESLRSAMRLNPDIGKLDEFMKEAKEGCR